jgi:hypothetical protein
MLRGYQGHSDATPESVIADMVHAYPSGNYDDGASEKELADVAHLYGFQQVYPVCQDEYGWAEWLTAHGPLLIQVPGYHSIVIAGVNPDDHTILVLDPWDGLGWTEFADLNRRFEAAGDWSNNVYATY